MLLPFTFGLPPASALIMLAGIFYGAQYGSSTAAILVNVPGETSSIVTCLDGHQMARQGRAGSALAIAAIASFFAGTIATVVIALLSLPLAAFALKFTAVETVSLHRARPARRGRAGARLARQGDRHDPGRRARSASSGSTSIPGRRA